MTIKVGDKLPNATFRLVSEDGAKPVSAEAFFAGRKIVLFGLPGAFTPTCQNKHLPGFIAAEPAFKAKGVDEVAMTSVNDHYVLAAWAEATGAKGRVAFLADGAGEFARAAGLDFDATAGGLGVRSKRYAMMVEDGVVKRLNVEDSPGKAELSAAERLLAEL
jgi:peroxiredoxin